MRGARMLRRGRKRAEERMDSECLITRDGSKTWDEDEGVWVPTTVNVYEGICQLKSATTGGRRGEAAGQLVVITSPELHLPADVVGVQVNDAVAITKSEARPSIAGREYKIRELVDGTQVTALRYRVEATNGR